MIQCENCEHFVRGPGGELTFKCDPFKNIKEPECLIKWQLLRGGEMAQKLDRLVKAYEATLEIYRKWQPMQEKMLRHMEREIDEAEETDSWKYGEDEEDEPEEGEFKSY